VPVVKKYFTARPFDASIKKDFRFAPNLQAGSPLGDGRLGRLVMFSKDYNTGNRNYHRHLIFIDFRPKLLSFMAKQSLNFTQGRCLIQADNDEFWQADDLLKRTQQR